jgi:hypothetical protein
MRNLAPVYCEAVLRYDQRVALDGSPAETIDAEAKDLADQTACAARSTRNREESYEGCGARSFVRLLDG